MQNFAVFYQKFVFHQHRATGDEPVDTFARRVLHHSGGTHGVLAPGVGQVSHHRAIISLADGFGDRLDSFEIAGRRNREAGHCSPSRSVMSKMTMRSCFSVPMLGRLNLISFLLETRTAYLRGIPERVGVRPPGGTLTGG
jgi:hypothetical protein